MSGVDKTYKRFLTTLQESKSIADQLAKSVDSECVSCPVCLRIFKDQSELDDTIRELKKYTSKLPQKMKDLETKIVDGENKIQKMIQAKPIKESYENLKNRDLANLKSQIDTLDRNVLPKIKSELKQNQEMLSKLEKLRSCSEQLQNEIVIIDKYAHESKDLEKKIHSQNVHLNALNASISQEDITDLEIDADENILNQLKTKKTSLQSDLQLLVKQIQLKQDELTKNYSLTDTINTLKEKLNSLKTKRNDLESKMQKKSQLKQKQEELNTENEENECEVASLNEKLKTQVENICRIAARRQDQLLRNKELLKERNKLINEIISIKSSAEDLVFSIKNFETNEAPRLVTLKKEVKTIEIDENEIQAELESLRESLDELKLELARFEMRQRELTDNFRLREKRQEYEIKEESYQKKKDEIQMNDAKLDLKTFKADQAKVEAKRDELSKEHNEIKTQMHTLEGKIEIIKEELEQKAHKNALEKYSVCASDLRVLEMSVQDMEKYYKALDRAVMNYHVIKMNEINKTIKQLWRQVYKGNDIDYIEIRNEEEATNDDKIKQKKTYNYRLVIFYTSQLKSVSKGCLMVFLML